MLAAGEGSAAPALDRDVAISALRALDIPVLRAVLDAGAAGTLPPEVAALFGDLSALAAFMETPGNEARARKAELGRLVWRRLADVLDGRIREDDAVVGLSESQVASLRSLITATVAGRPFRLLSFPLHPGELGWLDVLLRRISEQDAAQAPPVQPVPGQPKVLRPAAASPREEAIRQQPIPRSWSGASMVAQVCQQARMTLRKGQAAEVVAQQGASWSPRTFGEVLDAAMTFAAQAQAEEITAGVMARYLEGRHGIPPDISRATIRTLSQGRHWRAVTDVAAIEELVQPHVAALLDELALRNGLAALAKHAAARRLRHFEADLAHPDVVVQLKAGAIGAATALLGRLRAEQARRVVVEGMGNLDVEAITSLSAAGDGRAAVLVRSLMPTMGASFDTAARSVGAALGGSREQAKAFAEAAKAGERVVKEREAEALRRTAAWEASLLRADDARVALGVKQAEFRRWLDEGRIPVAKRVAFRKWGADLTTTRHDPAEIERIKPEVARWREEHAREQADARREAARQAARTRAATRVPDPPEVVRARRLAAIVKSAGLDATPGALAVALKVRIPVLEAVTWTVRVAVAIPAALEAAVSPDGKPAAGRVRKAAVEALQEAARSASSPVEEDLATVVSAWRERAGTVADGFPADGAEAFRRRLLRELANACEDGGSPTADAGALAGRLARLLERALVEAVNIHARDWGVDDLRVRSGLADYAAMFPQARAKRRRFVLHLGPTNSGKTHAAMTRLAAARSGAYLAPLRLMALEGAERLNGERGTPTSMVTGEEIQLVEGARHVSATIEMADLASDIEVAVIDEVQMIADRDRGWAWTQALVGIPADEVLMTGSLDALPYVTRIARMTGDELKVVMFERMTPLEALPKPVGFGSIGEGDAVVAFSRAEVLRIRDALVERGLQVATIYGALGPEVRRTQAARFRSGDAKVLVATDAIAMGLNLPIRRVLLSATTKFDGVSVRPLNESEIRQIAGRAGRYGIAERGEAGVLPDCDPSVVRVALAAVPRQPKDDRVPVMPPWAAVEAVSEALVTEDLGRILRHVTETLLKGAPDLRAPSLDDALAVSSAISRSGLSLRQRFRYLGCPIDARQPTNLAALSRWASVHATGGANPFPASGISGTPDTDHGLALCEQAVKMLSAYLWLAMRYPDSYPDQEAAAAERDRVNRLIDAALRRRSLGRSCRNCGARLRRGHRFPICDDCFRGRH